MKNLRRIRRKAKIKVKRTPRKIGENSKKIKNKFVKFKKTGDIGQYDVSTATLKEMKGEASHGSIELDQGFTIQWGKIFHLAGDANQPQEYKFGKVFKRSCFGVILNMQRNGIKSANARDITKVGFNIDSDDELSGDRFINYIAIGY